MHPIGSVDEHAYQILLIEELARAGVETLFIRSPRATTAEDQLLLQFRFECNKSRIGDGDFRHFIELQARLWLRGVFSAEYDNRDELVGLPNARI